MEISDRLLYELLTPEITTVTKGKWKSATDYCMNS